MKAIEIEAGHTVKLRDGDPYHTIKSVTHIKANNKTCRVQKVILISISGTLLPELDPDQCVTLSPLDSGIPP